MFRYFPRKILRSFCVFGLAVAFASGSPLGMRAAGSPAGLTLSNLTVRSGQAYEVINGGLRAGAMKFVDRNYTFQSVPSRLEGKTYIKTACSDKNGSGEAFLSFDVNRDVTVYIGFDDRIKSRPSWLESFTDTGSDLKSLGGGGPVTASLLKKEFAPSRIELGGNGGIGGNCEMYSVVLVAKGNGPSGGSGERAGDSTDFAEAALQDGVVYEAENAAVVGAAVSTQWPGFTGTGYVDFQNPCGDSIEWTVNVKTCGTYLLQFRYANGSSDHRPLEIRVNGELLLNALPFPPTGGWDVWTKVAARAPLNPGANTIRATAAGSNGGNLDHLAVLGPVVPSPIVKGPKQVSGTLSGVASGALTTVAEPTTGITLAVYASGSYSVSIQDPAWVFQGEIGAPLTSVAANAGSDTVGTYQEIAFDYTDVSPRKGAIRTYAGRPAVLFTMKCLEAVNNSSPFPVLTYPRDLHHLSFNCLWGAPSFISLGRQSPWLFFHSADAFVISPAANFMVSDMSLGNGSITSGIRQDVSSFPKDFTHQTLLVIDKGIHRTWTTWGNVLTDLQGKVRPANDADIGLKYFGYWTDAGSTYYYNYDHALGYEGTLLAVRDSFAQKGIPLGYMQLDSWWYPKGPAGDWAAAGGGIWTYDAHPSLFPNGLKDFQQRLGLPLMTHARWFEVNGPYRGQYRFSGWIIVDPLYWNDRMAYLKENGVFAFEQDWLSGNAAPPANSMSDNNAFFDNMAAACSANGLSMQYCMVLPCHYLQSTRYSHLTTMRVSWDRFQRSTWDQFLYGSILARAVGGWPWADVFVSSEKENMMLEVLSAGMVGVGDPIGSENKANILLSCRKDAVIVKPDSPIVPTEETILNDAHGATVRPMVASTSTDHGALRTLYVFAYTRGTDTNMWFKPSSLGLAGDAVVYNFNTGTARVVNADGPYTDALTPGGYAYYIVAPVRSTGIAFLGDAGKIASVGRKRISRIVDDAAKMEVTVSFATEEGPVTLRGYALAQPKVTALEGTAGPVFYDATTKLFTVDVTSGPADTATIVLAP